MLLTESIKTALDSIRSNATRSFLTALAIIIGIASVIAMLSIGATAQQALEDEINALGGRILSVYAGQTRRGGVKGSYAPLEIKDAEALRRFTDFDLPFACEASRAHLIDKLLSPSIFITLLNGFILSFIFILLFM